MSKAPLVALEGKLGKFGHPRTFKVEGLGHLTKTKGHYMLHASITASEAMRLAEAAKKVPAEEEAHTRGRAGIGAANVYAKGDSYYIPNLPNTRSQPIEVVREGRQTTAGAAYFSALQDKGSEEDKATTMRALGAEGDLMVAHMPWRFLEWRQYLAQVARASTFAPAVCRRRAPVSRGHRDRVV